MRESMIILCAKCGGPGKAVVDTVTDDVVEVFFACGCPRPGLPTVNTEMGS